MPPMFAVIILVLAWQTIIYLTTYFLLTLLGSHYWVGSDRGLTPAIFRAFPLHAIIFVTYEMVMIYLK